MDGGRIRPERAAAAAAVFWCSAALACPFCNPSLTLTERIDQAHAAYAVEWISAVPGNADRRETGSTQLRVRHVFKDDRGERRSGDAIALPDFSPGEPGQIYLLFGHLREGERLAWDGLTRCPAEMFDYLVSRPPAELPLAERLPYFLPFLEHEQESIAVDAYSEFANAPYEAIRELAPRFPREKLAEWIKRPDGRSGRIARIGFYGLVLGLCGGNAEAEALEREILSPGDPAADLRLGIDGLMAGYLMLRGDAGLEVLKRHAYAPGAAPSDAFALQQAVRFQWDHGGGRIRKESLRAALRPLVVSPQFAELVIVDLTRWEDLSLVDQLIELYDDPEFANLPTQTAIARFYLAMAALDPAGRPGEEAEAIRRAEVHLADLRRRDAELVDRADKLFRSRAVAAVVADRSVAPATAAPASPTASPAEPAAESSLSLTTILSAVIGIAALVGAIAWPSRARAAS